MCWERGCFSCTKLNPEQPGQSWEAAWRLAELWDFPAGFTYRPLLRMPLCLHHWGAIHTRTHVAEEALWPRKSLCTAQDLGMVSGTLPGSAAPGWPRVSFLQGEVFALGVRLGAAVPGKLLPSSSEGGTVFIPPWRAGGTWSPAPLWKGVPVVCPAADFTLIL